MKKNLAKEITSAIGQDVVMSALGVSHHSITNARTKGRFPASWFFIMNDLCSGAGIDCPMSVFNWRKPSE